MILFALHLPDGFVPLEWCLGGFVGAFALVALGCWRLRDEDVPRVALVTAAFFVSSSIHVPLPPSSVHLLLNGLVGALLGAVAPVAVFIGLLLQMAFLNHGGWTTLGVNTLVIALPALLLGMLFRALVRIPRMRSPAALSTAGGLLGVLCVLTSLLMQSGVLWLVEDFSPAAPALLWFGVHVPLALVEGVILACTVGFLARVKPELLGIVPERLETGADDSQVEIVRPSENTVSAGQR